jgi:hypothetical protein
MAKDAAMVDRRRQPSETAKWAAGCMSAPWPVLLRLEGVPCHMPSRALFSLAAATVGRMTSTISACDGRMAACAHTIEERN